MPLPIRSLILICASGLNDFMSELNIPTSIKGFTSLNHSLVLWFLLLSLLPLILVSSMSYQQAKDSLTIAASESLEESSNLSIHFIQNWFEYRLMDLNVQAESVANAELLAILIQGFKQSDKPLNEYVKSYDWALRTDANAGQLAQLSRRYDYIYDLFLIDEKGNILYSVAKESDLGTNLFNGAYANTLFAKTVKTSLENGIATFSDLERYEPSNNTIAGFIAAPLLDEFGGKIGVFAIQIRFDRVLDLLNQSKKKQTSLTHYLVGKDGLLRTSIYDNQHEILNRGINTEQLKLWTDEHTAQENGQAVESDDQDEEAFYYMGPDGQQVLGIHQMLRLPGVSWVLISEVDEAEALAAANWLGRVIFLLVLLTVFIVIALAIFRARRITRPIIALADISSKVAAGELNQRVDIKSNNELGKLADAFNDMLEKRQLQEEESQKKSREIQQTLSELAEQKFALDQHSIVAITDIKGNITFANSKFCEISGYRNDELLGQNHRILNSGQHDIKFFRNMYQTIGNGKVWHAEVCNKAKDGHLYWLDTTIVPFVDDDNKPKSYIAIRTDITERKKAEKELIKARDDAESAFQAKGEFLASMSHEIRTPMNGVLGMLNLLTKTELDTVQAHRVTIAQSSAKALLGLINDILDFSKVEAGKLELEIIEFNLRSMLGEFAEASGLQAQAKGLELILDVTKVEQSIVKGDPGRLRQVLNNLVGNAIKFTKHGEIIIRAKLSDHDEHKYRLDLEITDTGIGIPEEKIEHLFDTFSQVDASTTRKYGGTGLGLSIAKKISELMGGDVSISSKVGEGSSFSVHVLLGKSEHEQLVMPTVDISKLNLLVVDDNVTNREVLREQLEHWGATVDEAEDGTSALALIEKRLEENEKPFYDIALLDMQMPGMNGEELGKKISEQKKFSSMRLVMMTSMTYRNDLSHLAASGFSAYFPKPATTEDLFGALSVVSSGGEALEHAGPLVTHDYLQTLIDSNDTKDIVWPKSTRVLLVEDNQVNQIVAVSTLEVLGLSADVAGNGLEALQALECAPEDAPYTLVFMDCQMPEMDGFEASRRIRAGAAGERYDTVPIIALTANAMKEDKERCIDAGMSDYLAKPFEEKQMKEKLKEWLISN